MTRFKISKSDSPVRQRTLPTLPPKLPSHKIDLADSRFHVVLVGLEHLDDLVWPVWWVLIAVCDVLLAFPVGLLAALATAAGQVWDWMLLNSLPKSGISYGPAKTQWVMLSLLRLIPMIVATIARLLSQRIINWDAAEVPIAVGGFVLLLQAVGAWLAYRGYHLEPSRLHLSELQLSITHPGFRRVVRLLHVADVHLERDGTRERQLLEIARKSKPDLILFTGDFLNLSYVYDATAQQQANRLWSTLTTIAPVYAVSGSPPVDPHPIVERVLEGAGVHWLRDEVAHEDIHGLKIRVVGLTCTHDPRLDGEMLRKVLADGNPSSNGSVVTGDFTVLLYHAPDLAPQAAAQGVIDLHLAGHTHGGQVRLPKYGAILTSSLYLKSLEMGLYQMDDMLLFVSRGVGLEGKGAPRVRLNCGPQVALIVLSGEG